MVHIELPDTPVLRGQIIKGTIHVSTYSSYTAKKVEVVVIKMERYYGRCLGGICESKSSEILFSSETLQITPPGKDIDFEYTIPEDAPYTIDSGINKIEWQITALVKKSRFFSEKGSEFLRVLPHVLHSGKVPRKVPLPSFEYSILIPTRRPFHLWRYSLFSKGEHLRITSDRTYCSPGDTVSGRLHFFKDFKDVNLKIFSVFESKPKKYKGSAEKEYLVVDTRDTFYQGSTVPFSCTIPLEGYPSFETEHARMWWVLRAVITRPFRFTRVLEKEIEVTPLVF